MQKTIFFYLMNALVLIDLTSFVFVIPILPDFLESHGASISLIGLILSFYQISSITTSLYLSKHLVNYSKIKLIIIGQIFIVISNVGLGFLNFFIEESTIIIFAILLRLIQGASLSCVCSVIYSYVPTLFPENMENSYAFLEITTGIGMAIGPVIAGFLYEYTGFTWSFLIMSLFYILAGLAILPFMIKVNRVIEEAEKKESESQNNSEEMKTLEVRKMLRSRNFVLTMMVFFFSMISYCVIQPDFSEHIHSYNGTEDTVGIIFGVSDLMYALTGLFVIKYLTKMRITKKYLFIFGGILSVVSLVIIGPDDITFLPKNLIIVTIGMIVLGCSQMFYVPIFIPEILDILKEIDPMAKGNEEMASALFIAVLGTTSFVGSILGGVLTDELGFSRGITVYALVMALVLVIYAALRKKGKVLAGCNRKGLLDSELALIDEENSKL